MTGRVIRIERITPRKGAVEEPELTRRGYRLGDPRHGANRHKAECAVYAATLDAAAAMVGRGFSLWMGAKGKRASLIAPQSLRILREGQAG